MNSDRRDHGAARSVVARLGLGVLALVAVATVYFGATLWWVHTVGESDQRREVDAIVVLGAAQYDGRPSPQFAARLDHVVEVWRDGAAPLVVTTGGNRPGDRFTEAEAGRRYLVDRGVPESAIVEVGGATSFESLSAVRTVLEDRLSESARVLLVSDPFHSLRIRLIAQELGLTAYVSPTRSSPVDGRDALWRELREASGVGLGRLIGFRRLERLID